MAGYRGCRGFARAADNEVILIVDTAERPEDIDENRARAAAEESERTSSGSAEPEGILQRQFAMTRAMTRLKVKGKKIFIMDEMQYGRPGFRSAVSAVGAPGGARFLRVQVPSLPGSGKDIAEGKGVPS